MKTTGILAIGALALIGWARPTYAQSFSPIEQLRNTRVCQGCDFSNANLSGLDLSRVDLSGANLSNADLSNTNLTDANLTGANLYLAKLAGTVLVNAKLSQTNWTGSKAAQVNLSNADLSGASLKYADLSGANFTGANLSRANASDGNFSNGNFAQANFSNAVLTNADFTNANLQTANLEGANFTGANLLQASLPGGTSAATLASTPPTPSTGASSDQAKSGPKPYTLTPLQLPPIRLFNLETANQLPQGALSFAIGVRQFLNNQGSVGRQGGSGRQVNPFRIDYGVSDHLQIGVSGDLFSDKLERPVNGQPVELKSLTGAVEAKYQILKTKKLKVSVIGSAEVLNFKTSTTSFFSGTPLPGRTFQGGNIFAGSIQVPVTYSFNDQFQVHLTPAVSFFPDTFQGAPFYGNVFNIGAGVSWQPLKRLALFADVHVPIGPGGNAIRASNASIYKAVVWSGGFRYLLNPAAGLEVYVTNAFGTTPATQVLSFVPDSDQVAIAAILNFTPDIGQNYAPDFRKTHVTLTARDEQLLLDGFTIPTADTLEPRSLRVRAGTGAGTSLNIATGLTRDVQIEFLGNSFLGNFQNGLLTNVAKVGGAAKIRLLDQVQGDPFSLSLRATFEQNLKGFNGFAEAGIIFQYRPIPRLALILEPKGGVYASDTRLGIGLGTNVQIWKGLQWIGEYTPIIQGVGSTTAVWSTGLRYFDSRLGLGVDLYGSNAAGLESFGGLLGRSNPSVGFNVHWLFNP